MSSGLRESLSLNPGGCDVMVQVDPPSGDEGPGNDSDPPIENEAPEEGDSVAPKDASMEGRGAGNKGRNGNRHHQQQQNRKRRNSKSDSSYVPPYKKNRFRPLPAVLPSKFLLGGNIRDPLNLASLCDARVSAELNRVTPQSSPLPVQGEVPVYIPKNPHDPLGLTNKTPENQEDIVAGKYSRKPPKHRHHRRPRGRKRTDSECSVGAVSQDEEGEKEGQTENVEENEETKDEIEKPPKSKHEIEMARSEVKKQDNEKKIPQDKVQPTARPVPQLADPTFALPAPVQVGGTMLLPVPNWKIEAPPSTEVQVSVAAAPVVPSVLPSEPDFCPPSPPHAILTYSPTDSNEGKDDVVEPEAPSTARAHSSGSGSGPRVSSDYQPNHFPSPFAVDTLCTDPPPYESPFAHFPYYTPTHYSLQPFSPPPLPEIPHFQQRMIQLQLHQRQQADNLQRAVFHRPFSFRGRRQKRGDPIVSPVVPQPGSVIGGGRRHGHGHKNHGHGHGHNRKSSEGVQNNQSATSSSSAAAAGKDQSQTQSQQQQPSTSTGGKPQPSKPSEKKVKQKSKDLVDSSGKRRVFEFGNYSQYYGYRAAPEGSDPRLWLLKKELFEGKEVLDIGCNTGQVTLSVARDFDPQRVHGIDIDFSLIAQARRNIRSFIVHDPDNKDVAFPRSLPMIYGAMRPPPAPGEEAKHQFPYNVSFAHENYVLPTDAQLDNVVPQYDVIMCFSVTKWIHLNFGDSGLKRFFHRIFRHLRDNGILVLEPQPWSSYGKKKNITPKIREMYNSIKFFPEQFQEFLLQDVGFSTVEELGTPVHNSKGFQRPIYLFYKASGASSSSREEPDPAQNVSAPVPVRSSMFQQPFPYTGEIASPSYPSPPEVSSTTYSPVLPDSEAS